MAAGQNIGVDWWDRKLISNLYKPKAVFVNLFGLEKV